MTIEQYAKQLSEKYFPDNENIWARANCEAQKVEAACIEISEFIIDKVCECLDLFNPDYYANIEDFIEDVKKDIKKL